MILNNSQYNTILREYENKRLKSKHELDDRIKQAYDKIPKLHDLDKEIAKLSLDSAKHALNGDSVSTDELRQKLKELSNQKKELLEVNHFPSNFLDPVFECKDCKDTGYINQEKCHCFKQAVVDLLYAQSTIKDVLQTENFQHFRFDYYSKTDRNRRTNLTPYENIFRIVLHCKDFVNKFSSGYENLLIYGNTGVGKTYLVNCIAKELLEKGFTVIYLTAYQLFEIIEKNKFNKNYTSTNTTELTQNYIYECDLLIIDDLGTELTNAFVSSQLYNCINERHLKKKSTIISTNLTLDNLNTTYSERVGSRITGNYTFLNIYGDDIRFTKHFMNN